MKVFTLCMWLIILSSCGIKDISKKKLVIEPELQYLIDDFETTSQDLKSPIKINNLVVQFVDNFSEIQEERKVVGLCDKGTTTTKTNSLGQRTKEVDTPIISIKKSYFDSISPAERHELVFHELGHCILNLNHIDGISGSLFSPKYLSVMNPTVFSGDSYRKYFDYYMKQLFGKIAPNGNPASINYVSFTLDTQSGSSLAVDGLFSDYQQEDEQLQEVSLVQSDEEKDAIMEESTNTYECRSLH